MTRRIFVISDTHFLHENIIKYASRPFSCADEADREMIMRWNGIVSDSDIVYHLGDVFMGDEKKADAILTQLNGRKRLIVGNHDNIRSPVIMKHFPKIMMWRNFKEYGFILSHVPVHPNELQYGRPYNVHGHIHEKVIDDHRYFNVSVEQIGYAPIPLDEIASQKPRFRKFFQN